MSGTIKTLGADFNSQVRKGQVVAELDPSLFETQVAQERATVVALEGRRRAREVQAADATGQARSRPRAHGAGSHRTKRSRRRANSTADAADASVKSAEAQLVQAQASLNQAQVNLSHTIIRAPIDGVVISRNVNVGQTVAASMQAPTLFIIAADLERDAGQRQRGRVGHRQDSDAASTCTFRSMRIPNETFTGIVSQVRLQPVVEQNVVSYVTVIDVPNPDLKLKPGMTAAVTIETARADDALKVPERGAAIPADGGVFEALGQKAPEPRQRPAR